MKIVEGVSHCDHGLTDAHKLWIRDRFWDERQFFIKKVRMPDHLPDLQSGIYGPSVGDKVVTEDQVYYAVRGDRKGKSRLVELPTRPTRNMVVVAGPVEGHDDDIVLFTAYGSDVIAPKEPFDDNMDEEDLKTSEEFWTEHGLSHQA